MAFDASTRIKAEASWEVIVFVLDALVFILIGLALHGILTRMQAQNTLLSAGLGVAFAATAAAIVARLVWVGLAIWLTSNFAARFGMPVRAWCFDEACALGWAGMRGVVSLAAALALPDGFPGRDVIIFSTFIVILSTLVIQGLSLAPLIRLLHLRARTRTTMSELEARSHTFRAALTELEKIAATASDDECEVVQRLLDEYRLRVRANENAHRSGAAQVERRAMHLRLELALVTKSREALLSLHDENRIQDAVLHRIENELDLEEFRLQRLLEP